MPDRSMKLILENWTKYQNEIHSESLEIEEIEKPLMAEGRVPGDKFVIAAGKKALGYLARLYQRLVGKKAAVEAAEEVVEQVVIKRHSAHMGFEVTKTVSREDAEGLLKQGWKEVKSFRQAPGMRPPRTTTPAPPVDPVKLTRYARANNYLRLLSEKWVKMDAVITYVAKGGVALTGLWVFFFLIATASRVWEKTRCLWGIRHVSSDYETEEECEQMNREMERMMDTAINTADSISHAMNPNAPLATALDNEAQENLIIACMAGEAFTDEDGKTHECPEGVSAKEIIEAVENQVIIGLSEVSKDAIKFANRAAEVEEKAERRKKERFKGMRLPISRTKTEREKGFPAPVGPRRGYEKVP